VTFLALPILWFLATTLPSISRGQCLALGARHAPKLFLIGLLPKVIVPKQLDLLPRSLFFGDAVIDRGRVRSSAARNTFSTGPLPAKESVLAVIVIIAITFTFSKWKVGAPFDWFVVGVWRTRYW